jgi:hypothetical protein
MRWPAPIDAAIELEAAVDAPAVAAPPVVFPVTPEGAAAFSEVVVLEGGLVVLEGVAPGAAPDIALPGASVPVTSMR